MVGEAEAGLGASRNGKAWRTTGRSAWASVAVMGILLLGGALALPMQQPDPLPMPLTWTAAEYHDGRVYLFGGQNMDDFAHDAIRVYDLADGTTVTLAATLPLDVYGAASVTDPRDGSMYLLGGRTWGDPWRLDTIIRFDPVTHAATVLDVRLPTALAHSTAVWHEGKAYLFGGETPSGQLQDIWTFDPLIGVVEDSGDDLPFARQGASAVDTGDVIWIFGGYAGSIGYTGQVVKYWPETGVVDFNFQAPLPSPRAYTHAVWDGTTAWVLGGTGNDGTIDEVVSFTHQVVSEGSYIANNQNDPLARPVFGAGSIYVPIEDRIEYGTSMAVLFGGYANGEGFLDDVVAYDPAPRPVDTAFAFVDQLI